MKIYISYFGNLSKLQKADIIPISISLWPPRYYNGIRLTELAPEKRYIHWPEHQYRPEYQKKLNSINAKEILGKILKLSNGKDVALCCYEKPGEFCHRQMVADWITKETGKPVEEFGKVLQQSTLF